MNQKTALFRRIYTQTSTTSLYGAKNPPYAAKTRLSDGYKTPSSQNYDILRQKSEIGGLTARNMRFMAYFRFIGKVHVRKPQEKPRVSVCPARSSARMGPLELVGAEVRAGKSGCRFHLGC